MVQPLFIERDDLVTKVASETSMPEDTNQWPTEILQELYKQVPYISDFNPDVIMDRVDGERRYGFGHIEVSNKTEIQDSPESPTSQAAGIRHVRIPIVIREGKLCPFDILVSDGSKMLPLTERRLRSSLFRPQVFDVTSRTPGDQSLISQLYPPYRQNYGFGGGGATMSAGMGKEGAVSDTVGTDFRALAAAQQTKTKQDQTPGDVTPMTDKVALLAAILPTIDARDFHKFGSALADPTMRAAFHANRSALAPSLAVLGSYKTAESLSVREAKLAAMLPASVVQISRSPSGTYMVKSATHNAWAPRVVEIDRGVLYQTYGAKIAADVDTTGAVTMAEGGTEADLPENDLPELISSYGIYKVQDSNGKALIGFVFPNLLDIDGKPLPISLFTNGSQMATQADIAGVHVADGAALIEGKPQGHGVFYKVLANGKAVATVPLDIQNSVTSPEGEVSLVASSALHGGVQVQVQISSNLAVPTAGDEQTLLMPADWCWMPLEGVEDVELVGAPDGVAKEGSYDYTKVIEIRAGDAHSFSLSGIPVEKLAQDSRSFLSADDAMFILAGAGISPAYAVQKLAEAFHLKDTRSVMATREIVTFEQAKQAAVARVGRVPNFRQDFFKEAAYVPDSGAVDTVLSLGFINPENLLTFIGYMPVLDEAQEKLCELLMASRMGLRDIPGGVLERVIRGIENTLEGLRSLSFSET